MRRLSAILLLALLGYPTGLKAFSCPHLEADARRAMAGWQVPGLVIGVVEDGMPVGRHTLGVRDIASGAPVTPTTLFAIGSISKSMTALSLAIPHARNELSLDLPVRTVLPYFPAGITARHLLSHSAGWPRHDALWYLDSYDRHTLPAKLARLPRFAAPGASFQYNNVPFAAAGVFLAEFTGVPWDDRLRTDVLDPAGMRDTVTRLSAFRDNPVRATAYFPAREGRIVIPLRDTDPVAPAAGVYSNLTDMMRYTALLAADGRMDERQVFPADAVKMLRREASRGYGLGLRLGEWRGERMAFHPGFVDGYGARLSILPERRSGVIVLSNMSGETPVSRIVSQTALDCLVGAGRTDWIARFGHRRPAAEQKPDVPTPAPPDRPETAYEGTFAHAAYGAFAFHAADGTDALNGRFHGKPFVLDYAGGDAWRLRETVWPLREGLVFSFHGLENGRFSRLSTPLADGPTYRHNAGPIEFARLPLVFPRP